MMGPLSLRRTFPTPSQRTALQPYWKWCSKGLKTLLPCLHVIPGCRWARRPAMSEAVQATLKWLPSSQYVQTPYNKCLTYRLCCAVRPWSCGQAGKRGALPRHTNWSLSPTERDGTHQEAWWQEGGKRLDLIRNRILCS